MPPPRIVHVGERYGLLVVTKERRPGEPNVDVLCDCGTELTVRLHNLGRSARSCGCRVRAATIARSTKHGMAGTRIYNIWSDMIGRCSRPTHARYADYGGRGITVCERWRDFASFYADMGERPAGRTLDRIDNDRGYSPANCRWATLAEQRHNRREQRQAEACRQGHEYTPENTRITPAGAQACRTCAREYARNARKRQKAARSREAA